MLYFYKCYHKHEFYTFFPFIFGQLAQLFNQTFRFSPRFFIRFRFDFQNKCRRRLAQNHSYPHECLQLLKVRIWFLENLGRNYDWIWIEILQKFINHCWKFRAQSRTSNRKAWDRFWEENLGNETEFFVNELLAQRLQAT